MVLGQHPQLAGVGFRAYSDLPPGVKVSFYLATSSMSIREVLDALEVTQCRFLVIDLGSRIFPSFAALSQVEANELFARTIDSHIKDLIRELEVCELVDIEGPFRRAPKVLLADWDGSLSEERAVVLRAGQPIGVIPNRSDRENQEFVPDLPSVQTCPNAFSVRANSTSRQYYLPADPGYLTLICDICFPNADEAKKAGFSRWQPEPVPWARPIDSLDPPRSPGFEPIGRDFDSRWKGLLDRIRPSFLKPDSKSASLDPGDVLLGPRVGNLSDMDKIAPTVELCEFRATFQSTVVVDQSAVLRIDISIAGSWQSNQDDSLGFARVVAVEPVWIRVLPRQRCTVLGSWCLEVDPPTATSPRSAFFEILPLAVGEGEIWVMFGQQQEELLTLALHPTFLDAEAEQSSLLNVNESHQALAQAYQDVQEAEVYEEAAEEPPMQMRSAGAS